MPGRVGAPLGAPSLQQQTVADEQQPETDAVHERQPRQKKATPKAVAAGMAAGMVVGRVVSGLMVRKA